MSEPAIGWISEVVIDGPDPWVLARFWAGLLGGTPVEWYPGWVRLEPPPNGQRLSFQATATPLAPDTARVHFDILADHPARVQGHPELHVEGVAGRLVVLSQRRAG